MQGINPLTMKCTYETPCGWCTKWDKKCDKKIGNDQSSKEKYGKLVKSCYECDKEGWDMPECKECNTANGFKYFERKKN